MMHDKDKYDLAISKAAKMISNLVSDQYQQIIERKSPEEAWNTFQERFPQINPIST